MKQIPIFFKSDFTAILASEAQWGGVPFRLKFYTASPSRAFVACYDGEHYENCRLLEDGRLEIAFNQKDGTVQTLMGIGMLMLAPEFYLTNDAYRDHICNQFIKPFAPVFVDEDGEEYNLVLGLEGAATIVTVGTLPAFYQKGEPGLTPEEHDALVQATENANAAADRANGEAQLANTAAENANTEAGNAAEAARLADEAREQLTTTFNEKVAELDADYTAKKQALDADYASVKQSLGTDYANTKVALEADYTAKKAALDADYASVKAALSASYSEAIAAINQRMSAIETQFATDRIAWQHQVDAILTKCIQDFEAAEAERESRVAAAIAEANTATANANQKATEAGNVNAVLNGDELTVTDRNGQSVTRNVRGPQGEPGASVTFFPAVTIFGQPHIDGPQISGFSANDYLQFPFVVNFAGRPWELHFDIATGAEVNQQHNIFDSNFGLAFAFANGHFVMAMSSNGTSWDLGANEGTHAILPNQTYHIRMSWDGQTYKLEWSIDEVQWVTDITVSSTASLYPRQIVIGKDIFTGTHFYNGSINFAHAQLKIAGLVVWEGMEEIGTATRMAIDMSNIDEAGEKKLNEVAMEGAVGESIASGVHLGAVSGLALNLMPKANTTAQEFVRQITGGSYAASVWDGGVAKIERVKGKTLVWNQLGNRYNQNLVNCVVSESSVFNKYTIKNVGQESLAEISRVKSTIGHHYLVVVQTKSDGGSHLSGVSFEGVPKQYSIFNQGENNIFNFIVTSSNGGNVSCSVRGVETDGYLVTAIYLSRVVYDLTQMFGEGNEPTTYEEFLQRKPKVSDEYAYNEGELVNMTAEGVRSTNADGTSSEDRKWTETIRKYFPDGMKSVSDVFDDFTPTKASARIGVWEFDGTENWGYNGTTNIFFLYNNKGSKNTSKLVSSQYDYGPIGCTGKDKSGLIYLYIDQLYITDFNYTNLSSWKSHIADLKAAGTPLTVYYELADPIVTEYDELNLTYTAHKNGVEEAIVPDGVESTPLKADITYGVDAYGAIINLLDRVAALEGK